MSLTRGIKSNSRVKRVSECISTKRSGTSKTALTSWTTKTLTIISECSTTRWTLEKTPTLSPLTTHASNHLEWAQTLNRDNLKALSTLRSIGFRCLKSFWHLPKNQKVILSDLCQRRSIRAQKGAILKVQWDASNTHQTKKTSKPARKVAAWIPTSTMTWRESLAKEESPQRAEGQDVIARARTDAHQALQKWQQSSPWKNLHLFNLSLKTRV